MDEPTTDSRVETFSMSLVPETSAVVPVHQRETGETECVGGKAVDEGRVENRSNRKAIRPVFRPERRKIHMGADRPGPTRPKHDSAEIDRTIPIQKGADSVKINRSSLTRRNANADEGQSSRETIDGDRSGQGLSRPNRRSTGSIHNTQLKPVSAGSVQESNRRTDAVNEGRAVGSTTSFGRYTTTDRGRRCERRIWWIGWLRWFGWKDWACSKWKTKSTSVRRNSVDHRCQRSHLFTFLGTYRRMCGFGGGGCRDDFRLRCETE